MRWEGEEVSGGLYDPAKKVTAYLEFDRSMQGAFKVLKMATWVSLISSTVHVDP